MTDKIKVHVVKYADCTNLTLRYVDPRTGKQVRRSSKTTNRKEARKKAAVWEDELNRNGGRARPSGNISWAEFRLRYENEVVAGLADKTALKVAGVFNVLERILPKVAGGKLRDMNHDRISELQRVLREQGRAESTIAGHLAHLRASLQWAADMEMIREVPKYKRPKRAKRSGGSSPMKGRPITGEEFERLIKAVPRAFVSYDKDGLPVKDTWPSVAVVELWRHLLRGLWWSGLRLGEALNLTWDATPGNLCVDLGGQRPILRIPGELQKSGRDEVCPVAPEFAEFLLATPSHERRGRVFRPTTKSGQIPTHEHVSKVISRIGNQANVVVNWETKLVAEKVLDAGGKPTGETKRVQKRVPKYASAHDLRRSFGERWSTRVMPQVLMTMMRHANVQTTMRYYVGRNAETAANAAWEAYSNNGPSTEMSTVDQKTAQQKEEACTISAYCERG